MGEVAILRVSHLWIPMPDGRRLAGRLWMPQGAESHPVPAIVEYHPYRKGDLSAAGDDARYSFLAAHGYACLRVDLAGTGDSDGVLLDEYLPSEQDDGACVIGWAADQPWCNGRVGMQGISWGGFNTLQVAARRPPALRAVVSACASDDRFADDVHYIGGCVVATEMLSWSTTMMVLGALPPDPAEVGERWRQMWLDRLGAARPWVSTWLGHQAPDDYWRQGSLVGRYQDVAVPVLLLGGWADGYRNGALRLAANLPGPTRLVIGPWGHAWPDEARPGPRLDLGAELVRWWDRWLKDVPDDAAEGPVRLWMQEPVRPAATYRWRPGRWLSAERWPPEGLSRLTLGLQGDRLTLPVTSRDDDTDQAGNEDGVLEHRGVLSPGSWPGTWCSAGGSGEFAGDQQATDRQWLAFTSDPLEEDVVLLGQPLAHIEVATDESVALLAGRLCHVWPDGASTLVTRGVLNLAAGAPPAGSRRTVVLELQAAAYRIPAGHRLRLSLSSAYWPLAWPSPRPVTLSVWPGGSLVILPVAGPGLTAGPGADDVGDGVAHGEPRTERQPADRGSSRRSGGGRRLVYDPTGDTTEVVAPRGGVDIAVDTGRRLIMDGSDSVSVSSEDPLTALARAERRVELSGPGWQAEVEARATMSCSEAAFRIEATLVARSEGTTVADRSWDLSIPRRGV